MGEGSKRGRTPRRERQSGFQFKSDLLKKSFVLESIPMLSPASVPRLFSYTYHRAVGSCCNIAISLTIWVLNANAWFRQTTIMSEWLVIHHNSNVADSARLRVRRLRTSRYRRLLLRDLVRPDCDALKRLVLKGQKICRVDHLSKENRPSGFRPISNVCYIRVGSLPLPATVPGATPSLPF